MEQIIPNDEIETSEVFDISRPDVVVRPRRERTMIGNKQEYKILGIYCTPEEHDYIKRLAASHRTSASTLIKTLCFNTKRGKYCKEAES